MVKTEVLFAYICKSLEVTLSHHWYLDQVYHKLAIQRKLQLVLDEPAEIHYVGGLVSPLPLNIL